MGGQKRAKSRLLAKRAVGDSVVPFAQAALVMVRQFCGLQRVQAHQHLGQLLFPKQVIRFCPVQNVTRDASRFCHHSE
jgi:hypothetical protein